MSTDTSDLLGKVYDLFSSLYASTASDQAFLAFETLGIPISDGMFKLDPSDPNAALLPPLAIERLSVIANEVPLVKNGSITRAMNTVDGTINLIIQACEPANANSLAALGATKLGASTQFGETLGSMDGVPDHRFHPVYASPADWYVSSAAANWTPHSVGDHQTTGTTPTPPPTPPKNVVFHPPVWRVVPQSMQYALRQPVAMQHPLMAVAATPQAASQPMKMAHPMMMMQSHVGIGASVAHAAFEGTTVANSGKAPVAASPMIWAGAGKVPITPQPTHIMLPPLQLTQATDALNASTTPQQVVTSSIDISFDHCIVMLNRSWFPDTLLMLRNWYVPAYARGDISNNSQGGPSGLMPVLTTGFVAIRNLKISAQWSQKDIANVQGSAGFGPFSLVGSSFDAQSGTLTCSGIQIIGWFCAALPVLPPVADPALPVPPPPTTTSGATGASTAPADAGGTADASTKPADGSAAAGASGAGAGSAGGAAPADGGSTAGASTKPADGSADAGANGAGAGSAGGAAPAVGGSAAGASTKPADGSADAGASGAGAGSAGGAAPADGGSAAGASTKPASGSADATTTSGSTAGDTAGAAPSGGSTGTPGT